MKAYIYILTNKTNTVLYVGVTSNIYRRLLEHKNKIVDGFSKKYNTTKCVYIEECPDILSAIEREKYLKGKKRSFKIELIEKLNPNWEDLSNNIY